MVSKERLGKRNLTYNKRHREYGSRLIMEDVDTMEYHSDTDEPVAMIETKHGRNKEINLNDRRFKRQLNVANKLGIPLFCLQYYILGKQKQLLDADDLDEETSHVQYFVVPVNARALEFVSEPTCMTEYEYVKLLYKLRGEVEEPNEKIFRKWIYTNTIELPIIKK